jgi:hypothetical protein
MGDLSPLVCAPYISEPDRGPNWKENPDARDAVYRGVTCAIEAIPAAGKRYPRAARHQKGEKVKVNTETREFPDLP